MNAPVMVAARPPDRADLVDLAPAPAEVDIRVHEVARLAGCGDPGRWSGALAAAVDEARVLIAPRARYAPFADDVFAAWIPGDSPVHAIAAGKPGWVYVATIGETLELRVREHFRASRYLEGVLLDAAGSVTVEALANEVQRACGGRPASARFSPGYCGWALDAQPVLLQASGAADLGVRALPSHAMAPLKTTTGIVVPGDPADLRVDPAICEACRAPKCTRHVRRRARDDAGRRAGGGS